MTLFLTIPFVAAATSLLLAVVSVLRKRPSVGTWCFFVGMILLGIDSFLTGLSLLSTTLPEVVRWVTLALIVKSFAPIAWLCFSLTYSRGNYRECLARWRILLGVAAVVPTTLAIAFRDQLFQIEPTVAVGEVLLRFGPVAEILNVILVMAIVMVLMNLEQTLRTAVGTMRWQIKFVVLGIAVIFGGRLYVRSQAILFHAHDLGLSGLEPSALLVGCVLLSIAYVRTGFAEIDVYPSRAVLRTSLTVLIVGAYLFIVGILAQIARRFGGAESVQFQAFVVLLGMAGLGVLLLSDRVRQRVHLFVGRHFAKAQHDSVQIWTEFSRRLAPVTDAASLCAVSTTLICETFDVLSTTIWLLDEQSGQFTVGASTAPKSSGDGATCAEPDARALAAGLKRVSSPVDLERLDGAWARQLRQLNSTAFPNGGNRWCIPLRSGDQALGVLTLCDRVNGAQYTAEELGLLQCIADQVTSVLLNLRLADEVARARELEAFRTMSAFFVHDLKNAASSLNLMLKNLPDHFDDPAFRVDALRGIGNTARRIDDLITRLTALRQRPGFRAMEADLNQIVSEALNSVGDRPGVSLTTRLQALPAIVGDRDQLRSVVTNLMLNACEAVRHGGRIHVQTEHHNGSVILSVTDNGSGMTPAFVSESLFRPFQSSKKNGLGIGMFQSRMIVEAHGGNIGVESKAGAGTTFRVSLPVRLPR